MSNKLTEEQKNVVDYSGCNLVVNAFAGSGKTTTGIEYLRKRGSEKKLYLCFNKSVQIEVQSKIKTLGIRNIDVLTAHSLAYRRLKISSEISPTIRAFDLVNFLGWKKTKRNFIKAKLAIDIFNYYCTSGLERIEEVNYLKDINPFIPIDSEVYEIITRESSIYDSALKIFNLMADGKFPMTHDFYLKLFQLSKPKLNYDIIFFDEGQDASPNMLSIFLNQDGCRKIIVGDTHQSIYGWRGAVNALEIDGYDKLYLTNSFRFGSNIANEANKVLHYKNMFLEEKSKTKHFLNGLGLVPSASGVNEKRAFLGRTNISLMSYIFEFLESKNFEFSYEGSVNNCLYTSDGVSIYDIYYLFSGSLSKVRNEFIASFKFWKEFVNYVDSVEDNQLRTLSILVLKYKSKIFNLIRLLKDKEKEKANSNLVFSTAHKSKGLEYDSVYLLNDFISKKDLFSFSEKLQDYPKDSEQRKYIYSSMIEELNLLYVAITRAKQKIYLYDGYPFSSTY